MAKKQKPTQPLRGGLETRHDIASARLPESSYIAKTQEPALASNRAEWVKAAFKRGVPFRDLIKGSGLKTHTVMTLCGLNVDEERRLYDELEEFRSNLILHRE
ncbi:hypothetical protein TA3x_001988 [Tundrisphaera sp. TA3]|uniref:hypothetical protein n=1 Tax=Tundrisphaera sp. TA3 TaxID=3435775 RepID=UPI003EBBF915